VILGTRHLFMRLLARLNISDVCDVGALDGAEALAFRRAVPYARVYAFEPNPGNFAHMRTDPLLQAGGIQLIPHAVSNYDGSGDFFLVQADYQRPDVRRGMSSLYRRTDAWASTGQISVTTTRLDTFLGARCAPQARLALWIDAEGKAYEVIEGLGAVADRVQLLHVEVENQACIGERQRLYPAVRELLSSLGLRQIATDCPEDALQFNAVFVRTKVAAAERALIATISLQARLRHRCARAVLKACPTYARHRASRPYGL
jgi:FkbM family methyltransferase